MTSRNFMIMKTNSNIFNSMQAKKNIPMSQIWRMDYCFKVLKKELFGIELYFCNRTIQNVRKIWYVDLFIIQWPDSPTFCPFLEFLYISVIIQMLSVTTLNYMVTPVRHSVLLRTMIWILNMEWKLQAQSNNSCHRWYFEPQQHKISLQRLYSGSQRVHFSHFLCL